MTVLGDGFSDLLLRMMFDTEKAVGRANAMEIAGAQLAATIEYIGHTRGPEYACELLDTLANSFAGRVVAKHPERYTT